ncbi:hypothetical protein, partial [Coprococcus eutactus]|uniref:hypothetical protein n=1 Tax=Coprococcus eutactus TaxID=33043 RepID=UPI00210B2835
ENSYNYDDISKEYIDVMLPSENELTGKEELNAFTIISDNFLELFAYKALLPHLAIDTLIEKLKGTGMYD